ncbi:MAG: polyphosphate polymerase domain-containing protein [Bacteroidetes bacterium]|nr:polyphosphate polymerase domain-containing protein [Bacteroidota bacterium]
MKGNSVHYEEIKKLLADFEPVSLDELDSVRLLNRAEKKFVMHISKMEPLLSAAKAYYKVLEINEQRLLDYSTEYYDTGENAMYLAHHNGRQNRYKVRLREYLVSGEQFLEVKRHLNNGRTTKKRIEVTGNNSDEALGQSLIESATPYRLDGLEKKLDNVFRRITLTNHESKERITIDLGLRFSNGKSSIELPSVVIIEIKRDKAGSPSVFEKILRNIGIHGSSVSKYCIGRALLEPKLKANMFQNKIRYLVKLNALVHDHINKS